MIFRSKWAHQHIQKSMAISALDGPSRGLPFSDEIYGLGAAIFFITDLFFEVPNKLWLEKIDARLSFLRIMVLSAMASAAMAWIAQFAWRQCLTLSKVLHR